MRYTNSSEGDTRGMCNKVLLLVFLNSTLNTDKTDDLTCEIIFYDNFPCENKKIIAFR
jgi:hypothetical protein